MSDFRDYKYIGMPFHAVGFPQPVYSRLAGSNDGVNWDYLKVYDFGWRDVDIAYINGEFWTATGTYINRTNDFNIFNQVNCPDMGLKNLWASEFTQDKDSNWWLVYCGSETDVDYSEFKLYASRIYPDKRMIDGSRQDIKLNATGGYIDPNINYINGKYYMWCSKTSTPTQELHLFKSDSILGPYDEVVTNVMDITKQKGFTWNEAPEMVYVGGTYYLYSDPWFKGQAESDRDIYRCESSDLINWHNMTRCNANDTMRHFTPLYIGNLGFNQDDNVSNDKPDNTPIIPPDTGNDDTPSEPDKEPEPDKSLISLWNGDINTFYSTNRGNYLAINNWLSNWNNSDNSFIEPVEWKLNTTNYSESNRQTYNQFINNANILAQQIPLMVDSNRVSDYNYTPTTPVIPTSIDFNQVKVNDFWNWVNDNISWIEQQVNQMN